MADEIRLSQADVDLAAQQEENERLAAQVKYFSDRVVILRSMINRLTQQINELQKVNETETKEDENDRADD